MQTFYTFETGCFNPRSREGSDVDCGACGIIDRVSIHAPAKGATKSADDIVKVEQVSIHAPAKGATIIRISMLHLQRFQSTLPRRERRKYPLSLSLILGFNPRSREGSDASS